MLIIPRSACRLILMWLTPTPRPNLKKNGVLVIMDFFFLRTGDGIMSVLLRVRTTTPAQSAAVICRCTYSTVIN